MASRLRSGNYIVMWFEDKEEERILKDYLEKYEFTCVSCQGRKNFDELLSGAALVVIDLLIKETDAILLCHEIKQRKDGKAPFVVIVGDKPEDYTHVTALDLGADDYIVKPVKPQLFLKRLEAMGRRKNFGVEKENGSISGLHIDKDRHLVFIDNTSYDLPKKEFELLTLFYSVPAKIFTREEIAILLWKEESIARQRTIDVHIRYIRKLLGKDLIKTVKGFGYGLNKAG